MKKIAIISAMEVELAFVDDFLDGRGSWQKFSSNKYKNTRLGLEIYTRVLGIGKVNAAFQTSDLINEVKPDLVINVGYAGGLITNAKTGDVAIGTDYIQVDFIPYMDVTRPEIKASPASLVQKLTETAPELGIHAVAGRIATGDFFLHEADQKKQIIEEFHPVAFDMESAAIAQVCTAKNVEFISLRTFSDLGDDDEDSAFINQANLKAGTQIPIERRPIVLALTAIEDLQA